MARDLVFERQGRSPRMIATLAAIYAVLIGLMVMVDAAMWLMAVLALPTLPALWDVMQNTRAGLRLTQDRLDWYTGRRQGTLALAEIDHMQFDTRWDFSVRVAAELCTGKRVRLPHETLPPHRAFEAGFAERGIAVKRRHFTVF